MCTLRIGIGIGRAVFLIRFDMRLIRIGARKLKRIGIKVCRMVGGRPGTRD